jgi:hypothetical protein
MPELWLAGSIGNACWEVAQGRPDIATSLVATRGGIRLASIRRTGALAASRSRPNSGEPSAHIPNGQDLTPVA